MRPDRFIVTASGGEFHYNYLDKSNIQIYDIAESLSRLSRFTGHSTGQWTVLKHSMLTSILARLSGESARIQLLCLLHDAAEAYTNDLSRPFKAALADATGGKSTTFLTLIENSVWLGLDVPLPSPGEHELIKKYDDLSMSYEILNFMPPHPFFQQWRDKVPLDAEFCDLATNDRNSREEWRDAFLRFYDTLRQEVDNATHS